MSYRTLSREELRVLRREGSIEHLTGGVESPRWPWPKILWIVGLVFLVTLLLVIDLLFLRVVRLQVQRLQERLDSVERSQERIAQEIDASLVRVNARIAECFSLVDPPR